MKLLHKINKILPDELTAEIWKIQRQYKEYKLIRIYIKEFNPGYMHDRSPIRCLSDYQIKEGGKGYNWLWERQLDRWIDAGRPAIDMNMVEIIYE